MAQDPYTKKKTDLEMGTEGARTYRGGRAGIPPVNPGIDPRFIQKIGVKQWKDGYWSTSYNGNLVGDSKRFKDKAAAKAEAMKHIQRDPDYNLPDFDD